METETTAHHAAAILNAAYLVRMYARPHQGPERDRALERMARAARAGLESSASAAPILYAIAIGLYDRADPRFR
jgi:hypothetical protein